MDYFKLVNGSTKRTAIQEEILVILAAVLEIYCTCATKPTSGDCV